MGELTTMFAALYFEVGEDIELWVGVRCGV
jgi:hypothetical protein